MFACGGAAISACATSERANQTSRAVPTRIDFHRCSAQKLGFDAWAPNSASFLAKRALLAREPLPPSCVSCVHEAFARDGFALLARDRDTHWVSDAHFLA
jgi:hypothetical protein